MGHNNARGQKTHNAHNWNTIDTAHEDADDMTTQTMMAIVYDGLVVKIMVINFDDNSDYRQGRQ